jgi:hypothetical protein
MSLTTKSLCLAFLPALASLAVGGTAHAQTAIESPRPSADHANEGREPGGLFDPFRIGAFGGIGFPRPLSIEGMVKVGKSVGLGLEYSLLPKTSFYGVDTTFYAINGDFRVFPFENGFFLGLAAGRQHLGATTTLDAGSFGSFAGEVTADTWFVNPRIGWLSTWSWGLTLGIDAGLQIPLSASFTNTIPSQLGASQQATDIAHLFGKSVLPTVDLLRVGLLL